MSDAQTIIPTAYNLLSLLGILSLAAEGDQSGGKTFDQCGGGAVLDMAAVFAGEIIDALEMAARADRTKAA